MGQRFSTNEVLPLAAFLLLLRPYFVAKRELDGARLSQ